MRGGLGLIVCVPKASLPCVGGLVCSANVLGLAVIKLWCGENYVYTYMDKTSYEYYLMCGAMFVGLAAIGSWGGQNRAYTYMDKTLYR